MSIYNKLMNVFGPEPKLRDIRMTDNGIEICVEIQYTANGNKYRWMKYDKYLMKHTIGKCPKCQYRASLKRFNDTITRFNEGK